jgi:AraC-like DNA-binding protein
MVRSGHPSAADVVLTPSAGVRVARLRDLAPAARTGAPPGLRLPVHLLALVTAGRARFHVDFETHPCRPGGVLWVRPEQLVAFPPPGVDATLVAFTADFPYHDPRPTTGTYWQPTGEDEEAINDAVNQIEIDYSRTMAGDDIPVEVLRHQLSALLLRLSRLEPDGAPGLAAADSELLARFRTEIDRRFARTRQVEDYARVLGCSVRTLTRAGLAATGRTAKQLVDERVALEAKRLLAQTDLSVAEIGTRLGFSEATNFGRFFSRTVGTSPGQFRADARAVAVAAPTATPPAQVLAAALAKGGVPVARGG